jgi:hypothetical protein
MRVIIALAFFLLSGSHCLYAQDSTIKMLTTKIVLAGYKVSAIKLVNPGGKQLGNMDTYTSFTDKTISFAYYLSNKEEGIYTTYVQKIAIENTKRLLPEIEVKKSFVDPEMKTNPKQYWEVSIAFKQPNNEYQTVGTTTEYRISYDGNPHVKKEDFEGPNRLLPFATKKAADEFAAGVKLALKTK